MGVTLGAKKVSPCCVTGCVGVWLSVPERVFENLFVRVGGSTRSRVWVGVPDIILSSKESVFETFFVSVGVPSRSSVFKVGVEGSNVSVGVRSCSGVFVMYSHDKRVGSRDRRTEG